MVAYKVMELFIGGWSLHRREKPLLEELLEIAAFATVCDVMELLDEKQGLL